jgi:cytochrome c-type biogenesis protein CcmH/NrfF
MRIMMRSWKSGYAVLFFLLPLVSVEATVTASVGAQEVPILDEPVQAHPEGDAAIDALRSPFCPGMMLEICPSPQAKLLRDSIQEMAWAGTSSDSLVAWMLAGHGEEYRAVPKTAGSGLWAWLMPPLALLGGLIVVALALQHFRSKEETREELPENLSAEDESVLNAALEELRESEEVAF